MDHGGKLGRTAYAPAWPPITALLSVWPGPVVGMVAARAGAVGGAPGNTCAPSPAEVGQLAAVVSTIVTYSLARHSVAAVTS
jgi:hypothetical protein